MTHIYSVCLSRCNLCLGKLTLRHINLITVKLVHISHNFRALDSQENKARNNFRRQCTIGTSDGAGVDKPFSFVLVYFVLVRVASDKDVHIHLPLDHGQAVSITPRNYLVAVNETNLKLTDLNNLLLRKRLIFIEATSYDVNVGGQRLKLVILLFRY